MAAARYASRLPLDAPCRGGRCLPSRNTIGICPSFHHHARHIHATATLLQTPTEPTPNKPKPQSSAHYQQSTRNARAAPLSLILGGGLLASAIAIFQTLPNHHDNLLDNNNNNNATHPAPSLTQDDARDPSLPRFRLSTIRSDHGPSSAHPYVTYRDKVYDITDWVSAHPGGDVILRAAGGPLEPYWAIFSIHNAAHVRDILDQYLVGYIAVADLDADGRRPVAGQQVEDPFRDDPERDGRFITHTERPRNAEPPNGELLREFRTGSELFYVRNHMWVPAVGEGEGGREVDEEYVVSVELPDGEVKNYTLGELKRRFQTHRVTAVLQCSGNRRNDMTRHVGKTNGLQWGVGAIGNAEWEGVRLSDVLSDAGLVVAGPAASTAAAGSGNGSGEEIADPKTLHVQFSGLEAYGASIPLAKALDPAGDVLLAFNMNGAPLPRDHGFPLRAIVPGNVAARSVKWLSKIVVADEESTSQWQRRDYKSFGPNEGANPDWNRAKSIQEMPVTSAITGVWVGECVRRGKVPSWVYKNGNGNGNGNGVVDIAAVERVIGYTPPRDRSTAKEPLPFQRRCPDETPAEPVAIQGYAYSGGGRAIARVDVSLDDGKTWDQAELVDDCGPDGSGCFGNKKWTWTRWRYTGQLPVLALPSSNASAGGGGEKDKNGKKKYCTTLVVKATDDAYNSQPETHKGIYNVRGNLATAWHRVRICPTCITGDGSSRTGEKGGVRWSTGETYGCGFGKEVATTAGQGSKEKKE